MSEIIFFEPENKIWAQIKNDYFLQIYSSFSKKRYFNFDKWGKWRLDLMLFPKIVKIKGIISKFQFFQKKNRKFAAVKKNSLRRWNAKFK